MKNNKIKITPLTVIFVTLLSTFQFAQSKLLDGFESLDGWKIYKSDGVELTFGSAQGINGNCIKIDYNFVNGAGYGGVQKLFPIDLPENFEFSFYLQAESPNNNLEFKLIDKSGDNVWWVNNRSYDFPSKWKKITFKKRHFGFAWGPTNNRNLERIDRLEFTIASAVGGKGVVYIDSLSIKPLQAESNLSLVPTALAVEGNTKSLPLPQVTDNNPNTSWKSLSNKECYLLLDLDSEKDFGGLVINWDKAAIPTNYEILIADDQKNFESVIKVNDNKRDKSVFYLKDCTARFIKINLYNSSALHFGITDISIKPTDFSATKNKFFINAAKEFPKGYYPRYLNEEAVYFTTIGVSSDEKEALINTDGLLETDAGSFSLMPIITVNNSLYTYNDVNITQSLADDYLPIPSVTWSASQFNLKCTGYTWGEANKSSVLFAEYELQNTSNQQIDGALYLTLIPFQANPYYQDLNRIGGFAPINTIEYSDNEVLINKKQKLYTMGDESGFIASNYYTSEIVNQIKNGSFSKKSLIVNDENGFCSGAIKYSYAIPAKQSKTFYVAIPFHSTDFTQLKNCGSLEAKINLFKSNYTSAYNYWKEITNRVGIKLPESGKKIVNTIKSNLGYILINRDRFGIQPGSRSYERSWIRDGALTSAALLKFGIFNEVKEFADWFSKFQFESGKVPCVVDKRGGDPVPENDSHGELVLLIKEYYDFTKDTLFLKSHYTNVKNAMKYMKELISLRSTDFYKNGNDSLKSLYGLLPESISHEGYSDRPMHSYWDDFFALKGMKDAVDIASILGDTIGVKTFSEMRDIFKQNLYNSINLTIKHTKIDYIPGCADKGDFDATSTTIALYPCNEQHNLPKPYGVNTFEVYKKNFIERSKATSGEWLNYTPYELRTVGSFILLDQPEFAHKQLDFFFADQMPQTWNHWAEVVWHDKKTPKYVGDMPHTWVGSDFINSAVMMFVYEDYDEKKIVLASALKPEWLTSDEGVSVTNLCTSKGKVSYDIKRTANTIVVNLSSTLLLDDFNLVLKNITFGALPKSVSMNGVPVLHYNQKEILLPHTSGQLIIKL